MSKRSEGWSPFASCGFGTPHAPYRTPLELRKETPLSSAAGYMGPACPVHQTTGTNDACSTLPFQLPWLSLPREPPKGYHLLPPENLYLPPSPTTLDESCAFPNMHHIHLGTSCRAIRGKTVFPFCRLMILRKTPISTDGLRLWWAGKSQGFIPPSWWCH